ncbi:hypothetical protein CN931_04685 [Bacillus sp. AFS054943]|nr:hypothetical protein CN476_27065 [Bacillus cereus]PGL86887.1 hypothetical protein CN931_04685 [Bacillus sp. AFS054943]PGX01724.1 hypothetical protein COE07_26440 [Bacillus sp. AFS033286]PGZ67843.1 hypothetical protein COE49_26400 [Bacillus sp. AFS029637]
MFGFFNYKISYKSYRNYFWYPNSFILWMRAWVNAYRRGQKVLVNKIVNQYKGAIKLVHTDATNLKIMKSSMNKLIALK